MVIDHSVPASRGRATAATSRVGFLLILIVVLAGPTGGDSRTSGCVDGDGDGFCASVDCDDTNADVYPGAPATCDGVNNDCADPVWPALDYWVERTISTTARGEEPAIAADVDGDGDMDVVSSSNDASVLAWYENLAGDASAWSLHRIARAIHDARSIVAADVDGDGDVDILSASFDDETIAWHENLTGNGTGWRTREISTTAHGAVSVFAADVDGDGDMDVLSAAFLDDTIAWYENTVEDGSAWIEHLVSTTANGARSVSAADLDGDGDVDILSASSYDNRIVWYENRTIGGSPWKERLISYANGAQAVVTEDMDGDGDVDVVLTSRSTFTYPISWQENTGGDGLSWARHRVFGNAGIREIFVSDLDGDGDMDVLSTTYDVGRIAWHENPMGGGADWTEHEIPTASDGANSAIAADLNGDGALDVLAASPGNDTIAWYDRGFIEDDDDGDGRSECEGDCDDTTPHCTNVCTDADGDGRPACDDCNDGDPASYPGAVERCDGNDNACTGSVPVDELDHDGDGYVGCFGWNDQQGDHAFVLGGSDCDPANAAIHPGATQLCDGVNNDCDDPSWPSFEYWVENVISDTANGASSVFAADVDNDGDADVLAASARDDTVASHVNFSGDGENWGTYEVSTVADGVNSVFAADMDSDGDMDVLTGSGNGGRIAWGENLTGFGWAWTEHVIATASSLRSVFGADVDGDGDMDVLSATLGGGPFDIVWYENTAGVGLAWPAQGISDAAAGAVSVFATDVDGDGDLDVLSASIWDDKVAWYEQTPGRTPAWPPVWTEHTISTVADGIQAVFAADIDGDGDADVLTASYDENAIPWYENTVGDGSVWTQRKIWTSGVGTFGVFARDMDGDGDVDVLTTSWYDDRIAWYENKAGNGSAWSEHIVSDSADGVLAVFAVNINGDGDLDILSASSRSDTIAWHERHFREEDLDGDGLPACAGDCDDSRPNCTTDCTDDDGDGFCVTTDCDDGDPDAYPGNVEDCTDGLDNDCNGRADLDDPACLPKPTPPDGQ